MSPEGAAASREEDRLRPNPALAEQADAPAEDSAASLYASPAAVAELASSPGRPFPSESARITSMLAMQQTLGNQSVARYVQRQTQTSAIQRDGDPDSSSSSDAAGGTATANLDEVASQITSDSDNALEMRIQLEPELVELIANPDADSDSAGTLPSSGAPAAPAPAGPTQAPQTGAPTGTDANEGLNPYRVKQGALGDCYLMAAMAAVARVNPDAIRKLIKPHAPGKYDVTLYEHRWLVSDATHVETVDATVPTDASGQPLYGGNVQFKGDVEADRPLWPLLIEKAYAQWKGGYKEIGKGGDPADALETLTGHGASEKKVADYSPGEIGKRIEAVRLKQPVTAWTGDMPSDLTVISKGKSAGEGIAQVGSNRVAFSHAYAVSSVELAVQTISLQNPWGTDNIEDMSLGDFKHCFYAWDEGSI